MELIETLIEGVVVLRPRVFGDARGYFFESYSEREFERLVGKVEFRPELYRKVYNYLKDNDPRIIFVYGEIDPWSAAKVPTFKKKKNQHVFVQPRGSHRARIGNMPETMKTEILGLLHRWMEE